eukprot:g30733.t1
MSWGGCGDWDYGDYGGYGGWDEGWGSSSASGGGWGDWSHGKGRAQWLCILFTVGSGTSWSAAAPPQMVPRPPAPAFAKSGAATGLSYMSKAGVVAKPPEPWSAPGPDALVPAPAATGYIGPGGELPPGPVVPPVAPPAAPAMPNPVPLNPVPVPVPFPPVEPSLPAPGEN